ncbi:L,D-transpeptidase family protein [Bifidobacterium sp. LC6]|uniref:L,D-transpeptidase family protein n=1 Tax=Bifidobacterium colobi TaxID=2809026 RepID=A0ABS5UWP2_9BIFI|nr:L,D-transpeptidase family protein [Bifidobacterium colobi]MBT1175220.1 L,D-transpeptidase family protein [Bifidobacterium colobi]
MTDNYQPAMGASEPDAMKSVSDAESTAVFTPFEVAQPPIEDGAGNGAHTKAVKRHVWPWIVLGAVAVLAAVSGGSYWYFQSHALPGVTLWGNPVMGQSQSHIAAKINDVVESTTVPVKYNGKTVNVSMKDLGLTVDSDAIASDVVNAKRGDGWQQYAFWVKKDVTVAPASADAADCATLNSKLSVSEVKAVDAVVQLNGDKNGFDVSGGQQGKGIDATPVAKAAIASVKSLGKDQPQAVTVSLRDTEPVVSDTVANEAKATLDNLIKNPVTIKVEGHDIASIDAAALAASTRIDANKNGKLKANETRNGYVVFDADKLQQYYENTIKKSLHTGREDRDVIVNGVGDVLKVNSEGHDGVTVADGADTNVGRDAVKALAKGSGSVTVKGQVDPMQTKTTKRTVVVDLSDHTVTAYENDKVVMKFNAGVGRNNNPTTGECNGDLCTPTYCDPNKYDNCTAYGDFKIWLKYRSQNMTGNLTLSDGSNETWDAKNVGFVNYFSKTGCAIHRVATQSAFNNAQLVNGGGLWSHGCVGIGWDVAQQFYDWALMGTTVHVQA